jgi:hypothetical protein
VRRLYIISVKRATYILYGILIAALLIFGWVADHALVQQARTEKETARSSLHEKAQMTIRSVSTTLAEAEKAVLAVKPWSGVLVGRLADPFHLSAPRGSFVPYLQRTKDDLLALLSSVEATPSGFPEAVVAAIALGRPEFKSQAAERLLSGLLPVRLEDLPYLAGILGVDHDARLNRLKNQLRRTPPAASLPVLPIFSRSKTEWNSIEGWAPTIMCPSPSRCASCWRECGHFCAAESSRRNRRRKKTNCFSAVFASISPDSPPQGLRARKPVLPRHPRSKGVGGAPR